MFDQARRTNFLSLIWVILNSRQHQQEDLVRRAIELNVPVQLDTEKDEEALIPIMECDTESNLSYTGYIGPRLVTTYIHITKNSEISKLVFAG